jgi:hypothetical protein
MKVSTSPLVQLKWWELWMVHRLARSPRIRQIQIVQDEHYHQRVALERCFANTGCEDAGM